jgi:hypothetical protein
MAIIQALCTSFKRELLLGVHDFSAHVFKIALYTSGADLSGTTATYASAGEVSGAGYTAGGQALAATPPTTDGPVSLVSFNTVAWPAATFTARGALIYNSSVAGNPAVAVLDFGSDKAVANKQFDVTFPAATAASAIVRIV